MRSETLKRILSETPESITEKVKEYGTVKFIDWYLRRLKIDENTEISLSLLIEVLSIFVDATQPVTPPQSDQNVE